MGNRHASFHSHLNRVSINMNNNNEANSVKCDEKPCCKHATQMVSNGKKPTTILKKMSSRNTYKCSVCKKVMRGNNLKRHMFARHSNVLNNDQVKNVVWAKRSRKDYHKPVTCSVCRKVFRNDNLKRHMIAKHKDVLNAVEQHRDAPKADAKKIR